MSWAARSYYISFLPLHQMYSPPDVFSTPLQGFPSAQCAVHMTLSFHHSIVWVLLSSLVWFHAQNAILQSVFLSHSSTTRAHTPLLSAPFNPPHTFIVFLTYTPHFTSQFYGMTASSDRKAIAFCPLIFAIMNNCSLVAHTFQLLPSTHTMQLLLNAILHTQFNFSWMSSTSKVF